MLREQGKGPSMQIPVRSPQAEEAIVEILLLTAQWLYWQPHTSSTLG